MKKFEALMYLKSLGLPICDCRRYNWWNYNKAIQFADDLRRSNLGSGLRTELAEGDNPGRNCPFIPNISNATIMDTFIKYKDKYYYIISESPGMFRLTQGVAYLMPDRSCVIYANEVDICSCRKSIEDPTNTANVKSYVRNWDSPLDHYTTVRHYLARASIRDDFLVGKRIEWSLLPARGFIFWQLSLDEPFQGLPGLRLED